MTIPAINRGQPIDIAFLSDLTKSINEVIERVDSGTYNYTTIDVPGIGAQSLPTSQAMCHATRVNISNTVSKDTVLVWSANFAAQFKYPPNVTCSIVNTGRTSVGNDAIAVITSVTSSRVEGVVKFLSAGTVNIDVNIQAIGVPV